MKSADYLKEPYVRMVLPEKDGTFRAEILEFPGCIAIGDTAAEALATLEEVAASWLEAALARGQRIPEPTEATAFSGKLVLRLPKTLHKKAAQVAELEGVSLNQFIVSSIAEQVGSSRSRKTDYFQLQAGQFTPNVYVQLVTAPSQPLKLVGSAWPQQLAILTSGRSIPERRDA